MTTTTEIPNTNLRAYILELAERHGVDYTQTADDELAEIITRLSDDHVELDDVELLLIALERAGVLSSNSIVPLHINYLREKHTNI